MAPLDGPLQPLRVDVDPLHAHLLPSTTSGQEVEPHLAFWRAADAVRQLKAGRLDAVLLPLAGMVGPSEPPEPPALSAAAALKPSLDDPDVVARAMATTALPFLVAAHHLVGSGAPAGGGSPAPTRAPRQPLLHGDLRRQGLLPPRDCDSLDPASWVQLLQRERLLLLAPSSLLEHSPWREGGRPDRPAAGGSSLGGVVAGGAVGAPGGWLGGGVGGGGLGGGVRERLGGMSGG